MAISSYSYIYLVGLLTLLSKLYHAVSFLYVYFYRASTTPPLSRYRRPSNTQWALITGGSDGIGYGFAQVLRSQGWNLLILAHQPEKLAAAKRSLEAEFPSVKAGVRVLVYDAITGEDGELERLVEGIGDLKITFLLNNMGGVPIASPHFRMLSKYRLQEIDDCIKLNNRFMAKLTSLIVPVLARNGPALIANLSSGAQIGMPWLVMYSATKGFVLALSKALVREFRAEGVRIDVISLKPGDVRSGQHRAPLAWNVPTSRKFAGCAVGGMVNAVSLGWMDWSPFWVHALLIGLLDLVPERVLQAGVADELRRKHQMFDIDGVK